MKAIVLSAGYATRLYPLTLNTPKGLLPIGKKSILDFITDEIQKVNEIDELFIISNHKFYDNFSDWAKTRETRLKITVFDDNTTDDSNKLGAIGDIWYTIEKGNINDDILVVAGDNFFTFDLRDYVEFYNKVKHDTILVSEMDSLSDLQRMANAVLSEEGKVLFMEESLKTRKRTLPFSLHIFIQKKRFP